MALRVRNESADRDRVGVAIGDQPVADQDESDLGVLWLVGVQLGDDRHRHEKRALLFIKPVRGLDLPHFLPRGHVDVQRVLDELLLLGGGLEEVDPQRIRRQRRSRLVR